MPSYVTFYHYTNTSGKNAIVSSGYIMDRPAGHPHAHFGAGTYGTSLAPSEGRYKIANNNWQGHGSNYISSGKVDWAIKVEIPSDKVQQKGGYRDILVHEGRLNLNEYEHEVVRGPTS
ncbi:uncharacterized protein [Littorina saxatilis]|uniref:Tox-ART-HYD1 domain-containing protein n=1 Tax=Littorina saxatilis TaxID=31220 RepID=A0AAN9BUC6_9CAEN